MRRTLRFAILEKDTRSAGVEQLHHHLTELVVFDRLRDVVVEASVGGIVDLVYHRIGGERHNGDLGEVVVILPGSDLLAGLIPVFNRHLNIALPTC